MNLECEADQFECEDQEDGVGVGGSLGDAQPGGETEESEVGETPGEAENV